jgi:hypothetical protein
MDDSQPEPMPMPTRAETDGGPRTGGGGVIRLMARATRSLSLRDMNGNPRLPVRPPDQKKQARFKAYRSKFPEGDMVQYLLRKYPHLEQQNWDFQLDYVRLCGSPSFCLTLTAPSTEK